MAIEIIGVPIVRDTDGLALSSRNVYLSADERKAALALPHALATAREAILSDQPVSIALDGAKSAILSAGFLNIDYLELVDAQTLVPADAVTDRPLRLLAAATIGRTRLLDNLAVG
jgi:pantoate--beta-alanine ligase